MMQHLISELAQDIQERIRLGADEYHQECINDEHTIRLSDDYPDYFRNTYINQAVNREVAWQEEVEYHERVKEQIPILKRILVARGWTIKNTGEKEVRIGESPIDTWYVQSPTRKMPKVNADNEDEAWIKSHKYLPDYFTDLKAVMELFDDLYDDVRVLYNIGHLAGLIRNRNFESIINHWLEHNE